MEWATHQIFCVRCKEQKESQTYFIFSSKLSKITLDFISELINLKYAFYIPFNLALKTILETSSQFHDDVQNNILPTLTLLGSKETFVKAELPFTKLLAYLLQQLLTSPWC